MIKRVLEIWAFSIAALNTIGTMLFGQWLAWNGPQWIMMTTHGDDEILSLVIVFCLVAWIAAGWAFFFWALQCVHDSD